MSLLRRYLGSPPTMDYLTVFATRSLVLFARPSSSTTSNPPNGSLPTTFSTSPHFGSLAPQPVEMPLYALMRDDTHCAWYLVDRVLEASRATGNMHRDLEREAEVMVWEQIDRAKMFGTALALLFGSSAVVSEDEIRDLAASHGLALASEGKMTPLVQRHQHRDVAEDVPAILA